MSVQQQLSHPPSGHALRDRRRQARRASFRPAALALGGAAASAGLLYLSAAPRFDWLAWVALVPAAAVALSRRRTRLSRLAVPLAFGLYLEIELVTALPFGIAAGQWGSPVIPLTGDSPVVVAALGAALLSGALWALRFGQPLAVAERRAVWVGAVLWPATCWTAFDFLRVLADPGSYWGPLFLSQADTPAAHLAAVGGPWVITFAVVSVNYELARRLVAPTPRPRTKTVVIGALAVLAAAWLGSALTTPAARHPPLTVAAIQPGYDTAQWGLPVLRSWKEGSYDRAALDVIGDLAVLTRQAAARGAELVVWPEGAAFSDVLSNAPARHALEELSRRTGAAIVVPYFLPDRRFGRSVVVAPTGDWTPPQPKQRPMWFLGERRAPAAPPTPVRASDWLIGPLLGADSKEPGLGARFARQGASLITSSTHDWEQLAVAQRSYARLNAAGTGLPVVRADWRYGSVVYGGGGRVLADAGLHRRRTVVTAEISPSSVPSPYTLVGDVVGWLAVSAVAAGLLFRTYRSLPRCHRCGAISASTSAGPQVPAR